MAGGFGLAVFADAGQSDRYGIYVAQAGLGLPDEAYYREESFAQVREAYVGHVARMLVLSGLPEAEADDAAQRVMALETRLASHHWDQVKDRDAHATYNPTDRAGLEELSPGFDWTAYLEGLDARPDLLDAVIVREPSYVAGFAATRQFRTASQADSQAAMNRPFISSSLASRVSAAVVNAMPISPEPSAA